MLKRIKAAYEALTAPSTKKVETEEGKDKKDSKEPWVEVVGQGIDPIKGLQYELDWNDAFIVFLRQSGYTGAADETVVGKWMIDLWRQTAEDLNAQARNQYE